MKLSTFRALLDAQGPDPARWPESDRAGAEALLTGSEAARADLALAEQLETALSAPVRASARLQAAVLAIPSAHVQERPRAVVAARPRNWLWWPPLMAMAASAVIGFFVGTVDLTPDVEGSFDVAGLIYGPDDQGGAQR